MRFGLVAGKEHGIRLACAMVDEMYGHQNLHKFMQGDCVLGKLNMLPIAELRPNPKFVSRDEEIERLRAALAHYGEQAEAIARVFTKEQMEKNLSPVLALLTELALDNGRRSRTALKEGEDG